MVTYGKTAPVQDGGKGVTRKVLSHSEGLMICEIALEKDSVIAQHAHPHEQITYIISGSCSYTVGGVTREVGTGDSVLIPGNAPHSIIVHEDMKVIDVFSPAREDFL